MPRQLLLLRHAKSAWDTGAATDFDRPLAKRGKQDAPLMGQWLRDQGLTPDYVVSSPAERAKATALRACKEAGVDKKHIHWDPRVYEASLEALLQVLAQCPEDARTVMMVGHNPSLEILLEYLCNSENIESSSDGKLLPTATVAQLRMPQTWKKLPPGCAKMIAITRPRALR